MEGNRLLLEQAHVFFVEEPVQQLFLGQPYQLIATQCISQLDDARPGKQSDQAASATLSPSSATIPW